MVKTLCRNRNAVKDDYSSLLRVCGDELLLRSASVAEAGTVAFRKGNARKKASACFFFRVERGQVITVKAGVFGHFHLEFGK